MQYKPTSERGLMPRKDADSIFRNPPCPPGGEGVVRRSDGFYFIVTEPDFRRVKDRQGRHKIVKDPKQRLLIAGCQVLTYKEARKHWGKNHRRNLFSPRGRPRKVGYVDPLNRESNLILDFFHAQKIF